MHNGEGRADLLASLDQLQAQLPNLKRVSLVVGWFGSDLRAGDCRVRPGVERRDKPTEPHAWSVAGLGRADAYVVSQVEGAPAYGGTPSDDSVRQAIRELKARGLEVTLYPFVFMDCPGYPWRGRVTGQDGAGATAEMAALFGMADGWGLRRMALHYARIAAEEGAHGLLIGSEMRGVTGTRDADGGFPAVQQFRALAAECRAVVGAGGEAVLCGRLERIFRAAGGRGGGVPSGSAVGRSEHRLCRHRLVSAADRLARGRGRSGRGRVGGGRRTRPIWRPASRAGTGSTGSTPARRIGRRRRGRPSSMGRMAKTGCSGPRT